MFSTKKEIIFFRKNVCCCVPRKDGETHKYRNLSGSYRTLHTACLSNLFSAVSDFWASFASSKNSSLHRGWGTNTLHMPRRTCSLHLTHSVIRCVQDVRSTVCHAMPNMFCDEDTERGHMYHLPPHLPRTLKLPLLQPTLLYLPAIV